MFSLLGHENDILTVLDACGTIVIVEKDHSIYFRGSMLSQKLHTFSDWKQRFPPMLPSLCHIHTVVCVMFLQV